MSEQSDGLITEVAKREHQRLKDAVVRAVKNWRLANNSPLATLALNEALDVLVRFESRHRDRLNG